MTLPSLCLTFRHHLQCVGTNPHKVFLRNPPKATGDQKVTGLAAWPWGHWKLWSNIYLHLCGIYIYIWLLCWADKTSSENKGTSTDLFRILRIQNLGVWPWALGLYAKYILQLYPHIYNIWVNYNNSLTWTVGPFGDDFPNYDSRLRENSEVVIWAPTFISYMSEIIEIQRSPSTLLLRITMALKTQSPDTTNRDAIKWCFQK